MFYLKFIQGEAEKSRTSSVYRRKGKGGGGDLPAASSSLKEQS